MAGEDKLNVEINPKEKTCSVIGDGIIDTPEEVMYQECNVSAFRKDFWDLWFQKVFRNLASMKFQLLIILYVPVIWGMFNLNPETKAPWITSIEGLGFLGGGYLTLATSRLLAKTSLVEKPNPNELDTEQ
jgi:hypothetical protein